MNRRDFILTSACAGVAGCAAPVATLVPPLSAAEQASIISGLRPPKRARPLVAVIASPTGAETCDTLVPLAVLRRSGLVDAYLVSRTTDTIPLMPALSVRPDITTEDFTGNWPDGADYIVVPAFHDSSQQAELKWIRDQASQNATIIAICAGAIVASNAGLIGDRMATTHWFRVAELRNANPGMTWAKDRRYIVDRGVASDIAAAHGIVEWDASHPSDEFRLTADRLFSIAQSKMMHFSRERVAIPIHQGFNEAVLALAIDLYANTGRCNAVAVATTEGWVKGINGISVFAETVKADDTVIGVQLGATVEDTIAVTLEDITLRYGHSVAADTALYLEYVRRIPPT
jgi:putative intracellular protease/amidase